MTALNQNFSMYAGDSKKVIITVTDDNNNALDLFGASVKWALKRSSRTDEREIYKEINKGIKIDNPTNGELTIDLLPSDTALLTPGTYYHECEVTDANGNVSTITVGYITISKSGV